MKRSQQQQQQLMMMISCHRRRQSISREKNTEKMSTDAFFGILGVGRKKSDEIFPISREFWTRFVTLDSGTEMTNLFFKVSVDVRLDGGLAFFYPT